MWSPWSKLATSSAFSAIYRRLLLQGFFAAEVDGHQNLDGDAAAAVAEIVDANYFAEGLAVEGARAIGIGKGDKQPHAFRIELVLGNKKDTAARMVQNGQEFA